MKTWKKFAHVDAKSLEDASSLLRSGKAALLAGGTDLLGAMRFEILPQHPEIVVNI